MLSPCTESVHLGQGASQWHSSCPSQAHILGSALRCMSCPAIGISESLSRSPSSSEPCLRLGGDSKNPNKVIPSSRSQKSAESGVPAKYRQQRHAETTMASEPLGVSSLVALLNSSPAASSHTVVSKRIGRRSCLPRTTHMAGPNFGQKTNKREGVWKRGGGLVMVEVGGASGTHQQARKGAASC